MSIVTRAEILFGLAKAGHPPRLDHSVDVFFRTVTVLHWAGSEARAYGNLRRNCESQGITIAPLDLMIAAQALSASAILVTNDTARMRLTPWLPVEDWTA
nr:PIN domain-containing protein [Asticcacaulis sp. AC402]